MIKPNKYKKAYREFKLLERDKNIIIPIYMVRQSTENLTFYQKLRVFFTVLFS